MILRGFEIEHWSNIRRASVSNLPETGVVVLHGPNTTGKSSIVAALRACLMDFQSSSTSKALERWFPRSSSERPKVSITFSTAGQTWRVTKHYKRQGGDTLERQTPQGGWAIEANTASEVHDRCNSLCGGSSKSGLAQLLWIPQTEFRLPSPRDFDGDVQSRLRGIFGILQTPLDDFFRKRVEQEWTKWFHAATEGQHIKYKPTSTITRYKSELETARKELASCDTEYRSVEDWIQRAEDAARRASLLRSELTTRKEQATKLESQWNQCRERLEKHRRVAERVAQAEKDLTSTRQKIVEHTTAVAKLNQAINSAKSADRELAAIEEKKAAAEIQFKQVQSEHAKLQARERTVRAELEKLEEILRIQLLREQHKALVAKLDSAEQMDRRINEIEEALKPGAAPNKSTLDKLIKIETQRQKLSADLQAASFQVSIQLDAGAKPPTLQIDGTPTEVADTFAGSIRREATVDIPNWGRIEIRRGSDARSIDAIEADLATLTREWREGLAQFGLHDATENPLDELRRRMAEAQVREPERRRLQAELKALAPEGIASLKRDVQRNQDILSTMATGEESAEELAAAKNREQELREEAKECEAELLSLEKELKQRQIETNEINEQRETAKNAVVQSSAIRKLLQEEHDRQPSLEEIRQLEKEAAEKLEAVRKEYDATKPTEAEAALESEWNECKRTVEELAKQLRKEEDSHLHLTGQLKSSAGLHQRRTAAATKVEALSAGLEREMLASSAVHRLKTLFEECRERQLGNVMKPIEERVTAWMRLLNISNYGSIQFNDGFMPEMFIVPDGSVEMRPEEESIGTQEQIAMLVRLALGSALSTPDDPAVAIFDDPLTHSDYRRLERMRKIFRLAAAGDPKADPPIGPLQILIFTCHPDWFGVDGVESIDLGDPANLERQPLTTAI